MCCKKKYLECCEPLLSVDITWKHLVLGFDECNVIGKTRNYICSIIMYAIYIHSYKLKDGFTGELKYYIHGQLSFYLKIIHLIKEAPLLNKRTYVRIMDGIKQI